MSHPSSYLAIDLGAESGRATLGTLDGGRLRLAEVHRFPNTPVRTLDGLHWDVLRLWADIQEGIARAARACPSGIASLGVDTWGVDFALLDAQGALIGNPYHYRDGRTRDMPGEAFRRVPRERIFELTGIQFMPINTLYQLLAMVRSGSAALRAASRLLMIPDLFNYWLTGQQTGEFTNVTTSQCYDPRRGAWAGALLAELGIPGHIFPTVIAPGTALGELLPEVAEETGAGPVRVIAPACHDTGSAVVAVPAGGRGFAWLSSGTWSIMGTEREAPVIDGRSLAYDFTNEGGVGGTYRLSKNIAGLWLVQECRRAWARAGGEVAYEQLARLAAEAPAFACLIDPDRAEFGQPGDMPHRIQAYCRSTGQPAPESQGAIVRCILESLALKYRWTLGRLEELAGGRLEPLHIVGGGSQNTLLNQFAADATGRRVLAGPAEATSIGNLLVQAVALGDVPSLAEGRRLVRESFAVAAYEPSGGAAWGAAYERFCSLLARAEAATSAGPKAQR